MRFLYKILAVVVSIAALSSLSFGQCVKEGFKTEVVVGSGSGTVYDNNFSSEVVVGQAFVSHQLNSFSGAIANGFWSRLNSAPVIASVEASDGIHQDRIALSWSVNENTPAITGGFKIYKDGFLIGNVGSNDFSFIDYNIVPGVYYTYGITGTNSKGEGLANADLGYVNPNGVVSGRVTTFSGGSVEGTVVTLSPSNNLSLRCVPGPNGSGGLYVDTLASNPNALVTGEFTLSMWMKANSFSTEGYLFDYGVNDDVNFWMGVTDDSSIYVTMADLSGNKTASYKIPGINTQTQWQHVAAAYNGRDLQLYFNGALVDAVSVSPGDTKFANARIGIGANSSSSVVANQFNGFIDEVRLFSRVQRPSEIKKLLYTTVPSSYDGLVAYWKMDEGKGDRIINQVEPERVGIICQAVFSDDEPAIYSAGISDASGYYLIEDVNYGNGTSFSVNPNKFVSYNTALEFNDIEQNYASTSLITIQDTATIELWFSPYHYNGIQYLMSANGGLAVDLYLDGNDLKLNINGQVETVAQVSGFNYKYLTIVKEAGDVQVYIDANQGQLGSLQSFSYSYSTQIPATTYQLARSSAGSNYYSGLIDGLVIWDIALPYAGNTPPFENENGIDFHYNNGIQSRMDIQGGLDVVNSHITAFIGLNDQEGLELVNEVPVNGALQYGTVNNGAQFVDVVAHEFGIDHEFQPNSRIVTLNNSNTSADQIDFVDITTIPISGVLKYEDSNCFIEFAEIKVDGQSSSPPTFTDAQGQWTMDVEPGQTVKLSAAYQSHEMFPAPFFELKNVQSPKAGIVFLDKEKRSVSGVVAGGKCHFPIIESGKTIQVHLNATTSCYSDVITLDENSGISYSFTDVPPGEYTVSIVHSDGVFPGSIGEFFDNLGGETVDVLDEDVKDIDFIYRTGHNLELTELATNGCGDVVLNQGIPLTVNIKVYEDYLGERCYLDTADLTISDGIGTSTDPDFNGLVTMTTGSYDYEFSPGEANIVSPYLKATQIIAEVDGAQVSQTFEAVVLGKKKRATTFTSTTPELPITVLRDPPGDGSFTTMESSEEVCMTNIQFEYSGLQVGTNAELSAGADLTTSIGIGAETELEVDVTATAGIAVGLNADNQLTNEFTNCISLNEVLETTPIAENINGSFIIGQDADIYIGAALNIEYGLTDILSYDDVACSYSLSTELMVDPKTFSTFYAYTEYHIVNDVIPSNILLGDNVSAEAWSDFVNLNQYTKDQAVFVENRSFDAGVVYSSSQTTTTSEVFTTEFSMGLDASVYGEVGVEVNGVGVSLGFNETFSVSYGGSTTYGSTKTKTIGYTLADDDLGDNFTVNIYEDRVFGTPVFKLISGESSCPWEEGTLAREGVQILVDNAKESSKVNVSTDEAALYTLYLGNTSQSEETNMYMVDVVNDSNPLGAVLSINGNVLGATSGGNGLTYIIDPNTATTATLALERGSDPNVFVYDSIKVVFQSLCDGDQITDTVTVHAHFVEPCSEVDISAPQNDWVITPSNNGQLSIVVNGYDETDPELDLVRIQYRAQGFGSWLNISEIQSQDLGAVTSQVDWQIGTLQDGNYELRALTQCSGGIPSGYSSVIPGIIEQSPPVILGVPQPADGILNSGDEISVTFNENINCNLLFEADQNGLNNIGLYNLTTNTLVDATIQCLGNKITIIPNIPSIYLENQTLEVRITGIEDLVGNTLEEDKTGSLVHKWDFYVNVSPVGWVGTAIDEVIETGTAYNFTRVIENTGGTNVNYTISLPSYISPSSSSGVLVAGGQQTITFTVDPQLVNGDYSGAITLGSSYGDEELPFDIRVTCPAPSWGFTASDYAFTMNYTVALDVQGIWSEDELDIVAGFIDGETRGKAFVQYVSSLDKYLAFLSVYGDASDNGKDVTFKIWDASECKLYERTHEVFAFAANGQIGSPNNEDTIHTFNLLSRKMYLNKGWNWVSFNLDIENDTVTSVMTPLSNQQGSLIRSQSKFSQYYGTLDAWFGDLTRVNELEMYQINVPYADSLEFFGTPIHVDSVGIPIVQGWNWISYLPQGGMTPDWAFQDLTPFSGDVVKNQYFFAQYVAGAGWIGNLTYMNSPSGYLYSSSTPDTLTYPADAGTPVLKIAGEGDESMQDLMAEFEAVNLTPGAFEGNMNVVGIALNPELINITDENDKIYAYIGDEVRGVNASIYTEVLDKSTFFISVYGNPEDEGKKVTFKFYDHSKLSMYAINEVVTFENNELIGSVLNEQSLTIGAKLGSTSGAILDMTTNMLNVYPNPTTNDARISFHSGVDQSVVLNVYNDLGVSIASKSISLPQGDSEIMWSELIDDPSKGVYQIYVIGDYGVHSTQIVCQ